MVSLIILLLGLFTAGVIVGVFIMALLELKEIDAATGKEPGADSSAAPVAVDDPATAKQS